jgi:hypothetical protein
MAQPGGFNPKGDRIDGGSNEYGLIAEQVAEHFPELAVWFDGKTDGLRYDLLPVALLDVVRDRTNRRSNAWML